MTKLKAKEKEQKEAEEKAKELIDKAEKVIETLDGQKSSDDPPIIIVQEHENSNGVNIPMMDEENPGNPFEEQITEYEEPSLTRRKSVETMDASTTTEDFRRRGISFDWSKIRSFFNTILQYFKSKPNWMKMKPINQLYIYTNTDEALDYIDDCAKYTFP